MRVIRWIGSVVALVIIAAYEWWEGKHIIAELRRHVDQPARYTMRDTTTHYFITRRPAEYMKRGWPHMNVDVFMRPSTVLVFSSRKVKR